MSLSATLRSCSSLFPRAVGRMYIFWSSHVPWMPFRGAMPDPPITVPFCSAIKYAEPCVWYTVDSLESSGSCQAKPGLSALNSRRQFRMIASIAGLSSFRIGRMVVIISLMRQSTLLKRYE